MSSHDWLQPLYAIPGHFLDALVAPERVLDVLDHYNITRFADLVDESFVGEWWTWSTEYFLGFVVVVCIALGFIVVFPLSICYLCCCVDPCCRRYYFKRKVSPPIPASRAYRWTVVLSVLSTALFALLVIVYAAILTTTNQLGPEGILREWRHQTDSVDSYLAATVDQVDSAIVEETRRTKSDVFVRLDGLPAFTRRRLEESIHIEKPLMRLQEVAGAMPRLSHSLLRMKIATVRLQKLAKPLSGVLEQCRERLVRLLPTCNDTTTASTNGSSGCSHLGTHSGGASGNITDDRHRTTDYSNAVTLLPSLALKSDYTECDDVTVAKNMADLARRKNFKGLVDKAITAYETMVNKSNNATEARIRGIKDSLEMTYVNVTESFALLNESVTTVRNGEHSLIGNDSYIDSCRTGYRVSYLLLTTVLLVLAMLYMAFVVKMFYRKVANKNTFYNEAPTGLIQCITFLCGAFIVAAIVALFTVGGAAYIVVCRPIVTRDTTLERYVDFLKHEAGVTYNVTFTDILRRCQDNESAYLAFDVEHGTEFNLSKLLDLRDLYRAIGQLDDVTMGWGDFQMFRTTSLALIGAVAKEFESIDFDEYVYVANYDVTKVSLTRYAGLLDDVSAGMSDLALASEISREANHLREVNADRVDTMQRYHSMLRAAVTTSRHILRIPLSEIVFEIVLSQRAINEIGNDVMRSAIANVTTGVRLVTENFVDNVTRSVYDVIGRCRPLYDAWDAMATGVCFHLVAPFNIVWVCYGVFICLCIPTVMITMCVNFMMMPRL